MDLNKVLGDSLVPAHASLLRLSPNWCSIIWSQLGILLYEHKCFDKAKGTICTPDLPSQGVRLCFSRSEVSSEPRYSALYLPLS